MGYEIDFLPVGDGSSGGDAIALRYGNLHGSRSEQMIIVIDGGYSTTGQKLVEHVQQFYHAEYVDLIISTHPDQDHIGGLEVVLSG
jgi:beta-lactamase superfamily II metal-dependent hydrolase